MDALECPLLKGAPYVAEGSDPAGKLLGEKLDDDPWLLRDDDDE